MPDVYSTDLQGYYTYPLQLVLAATLNAEVSGGIQIQQGYDFEVWQIQFISTGIFSIIWGTTNVNFMSGFVRAANILGTGIFPHPLPYKPVFPRGSTIAVRVRNDAAPANTVDLAFEGRFIKS